MGENPQHRKNVVVDHPHGEQKVEILGKNLKQPQGTKIVGGAGQAGKPVAILDKNTKNDQ